MAAQHLSSPGGINAGPSVVSSTLPPDVVKRLNRLERRQILVAKKQAELAIEEKRRQEQHFVKKEAQSRSVKEHFEHQDWLRSADAEHKKSKQEEAYERSQRINNFIQSTRQREADERAEHRSHACARLEREVRQKVETKQYQSMTKLNVLASRLDHLQRRREQKNEQRLQSYEDRHARCKEVQQVKVEIQTFAKTVRERSHLMRRYWMNKIADGKHEDVLAELQAFRLEDYEESRPPSPTLGSFPPSPQHPEAGGQPEGSRPGFDPPSRRAGEGSKPERTEQMRSQLLSTGGSVHSATLTSRGGAGSTAVASSPRFRRASSSGIGEDPAAATAEDSSLYHHLMSVFEAKAPAAQ